MRTKIYLKTVAFSLIVPLGAGCTLSPIQRQAALENKQRLEKLVVADSITVTEASQLQETGRFVCEGAGNRVFEDATDYCRSNLKDQAVKAFTDVLVIQPSQRETCKYEGQQDCFIMRGTAYVHKAGPTAP